MLLALLHTIAIVAENDGLCFLKVGCWQLRKVNPPCGGMLVSPSEGQYSPLTLILIRTRSLNPTYWVNADGICYLDF